MGNTVIIKIFDSIDRNFAVSSDDGEQIFNRINECIEKRQQVILDFEKIEILTSAFLNSAVGQLYSKYNSNQLNESIKIANINEDDKILFGRVITFAKEYFNNKERIDNSVKEVINGTKNY